MSRGPEACSGCGICSMSCPVWWETGDVWFTPHGRARAIQGGASVDELAESVLSCRMCGACEPACPENLEIMSLVRAFRMRLHERGRNPFTRNPVAASATKGGEVPPRGRRLMLLGGPALEGTAGLADQVVACLGGTDRVHVAPDDGRDLAWAYETGAPLDPGRFATFVAGLDGVREIVALEGILHRPIRDRCPGARVRGLADALIDRGWLFDALGDRDLLVVDARAYHADHARLVRRFGRLRSKTGCHLNFDLQRLAIPTCADSIHARGNGKESCAIPIERMLEARDIDRIVVESPADFDALAARTDLRVVHLAALAPEVRA